MDDGPFQALTRAVANAGGQSALGRKCGVKQGHVWHWLNRSRRVPAGQVLNVERETGVPRQALRPDLYPPEEGIAAA
jgi:DNA-binding transcriptional regulator YdaS (Cro superfamily)